jgi:hypothetical protein
MKQVFGLLLGLLGTLTVTRSAAVEPNKEPKDVVFQTCSAGDNGVVPACIVPASRPERGARGGSTLPIKQPQLMWLAELNQWRRMAGLPVVIENPRLSFDSEEHARYLVLQGPIDVSRFRAYSRRIGPGAHKEDSHSPSYTTAGAQAAVGGPLTANIIQGADVAWEGRTESADIDSLIFAPFHRLSLLAPWAQIGGYGSFGDFPRRAAALALRGPLDAQQHAGPIAFPPANGQMSIYALSGSEWPNPIAGCAGYQLPVGVPITLQIGRPLLLRSYSLWDQSFGYVLVACGFDAVSYRNSDATQQKRGRELLNAYGAIVVIPREPLSYGHEYRITIETSRGRFEWTFGVTSRLEVEAVQVRRATIRQVPATHSGP